MSTSLATALLAEAQHTLDSGLGVELKPNDGPYIRALATHYHLVPPLNWCALQVSDWLHKAYTAMGIQPLIPGSPVAQAIMGQLIGIHLWEPKTAVLAKPTGAAFHNVAPGNIIVWKRPPGPWQGHIGIVKEWLPLVSGDVTIYTIEGNSGPKGDRVALMKRSFWDANLLGFSKLEGVSSVSPHEALVEPVCKGDPLK